MKLNLRELRGLGIVALGGQIKRLSDTTFLVKSQSSTDASYTVEWKEDKWICNCQDYMKRGRSCKHVYAVNFLLNLPTILMMNHEVFERKCPYCGSPRTILKGLRNNKSGAVRIRKCKDCGKWFKDTILTEEKGNNTLLTIEAIDLYYKGLSLREIKHHLKQVYNVDKSVSTVHRWILKLTEILRKVSENIEFDVGGKWQADETTVKTDGKEKYLWNILDYDSRIHIVSLLADGKGTDEALKAITEAIKKCGKVPSELVTDGLKSYNAALRMLNLPIEHKGNAKISDKTKNNNRIERLHETLKEWIKSKRWLKKHAQEEVDGYRIYYNLIRPHFALERKPPIGNQENKWIHLIAKKKMHFHKC
ncbi:MAG: DDE-type integrase/transposase/recombinase [Halobacteria archaeon]